MKVSKIPAIILGILTFLPFMGLLGILALAFFEILTLLFSETPVNPFVYLTYINYIIPIFSAFFLIYLALGIFYFVHILKNELLDMEKKILWIVVLIILNGLAMPFYWYVYVWKRSKEHQPVKAEAW